MAVSESAAQCRKGTRISNSTAEICVWDIAMGSCCAVLSYHPTAVQAMAFSTEGTWLVSLGRAPERSVVLWDVATGSAVAVGRTEHPSVGVAWRCGASMPEFVTVGEGGAMQWRLELTHLAQHPLGVPMVCCCVIPWFSLPTCQKCDCMTASGHCHWWLQRCYVHGQRW